MNTEIITNVIYIVLTIVAAIFARYIVPLLKQKFDDEKFDKLEEYIEAAITLMEKTDNKGDVKFENVVGLAKIFAEDNKISVTDSQLEAITQYLFTILDNNNLVNRKKG